MPPANVLELVAAVNKPVLASTFNKRVSLPAPAPESEMRMKAEFTDTEVPEAKSVSNCKAAKVPPGAATEAPMVARKALAAPEIVPPVSTLVEICAPLMVPAAAAPAPVTTEYARMVSPEPVDVKVNLL